MATAIRSELEDIAQAAKFTGPKDDEEPPVFGISQKPFLEIAKSFQKYRDALSQLEELAGVSARDDPEYLSREHWIVASTHIASLNKELQWNSARQNALNRLKHIREALIAFRKEIIEDARQRFSEQITAVWQLLRNDSGAKFSKLSIPKAKGKGFKLEMEVKALISDGERDKEVDALRVFSESQVNVIGIAAYVTRAKLLGHRLLIFDDPVQSMDEEHFCSFADKLIWVRLFWNRRKALFFNRIAPVAHAEGRNRRAL